MFTSALWAETKIIEVNGMVCAFCAQGIEASLKGLPATEDVYINLDKHIIAGIDNQFFKSGIGDSINAL